MLIHGERVTLRPATIDDRGMVSAWLAQSDLTTEMLGPPNFPESPVPTFDEFCNDYAPHFWDGSDLESGRSYIIVADGQDTGHCNHGRIHRPRNGTALDIWLASRAATGNSYGTDALVTLCKHLRDSLGVTEFIIRPSRRNQNAVRAYEKAGFLEIVPWPVLSETYLEGDYFDTVFMLKKLE